MNYGDFYAVNSKEYGETLNHHFLIFLGNERYFDTIDLNVYRLSDEEAELACKSPAGFGGFLMDFVKNLPAELMEVVEANTKGKLPKEVHLFKKNEVIRQYGKPLDYRRK